jgi:hypothetical protein
MCSSDYIFNSKELSGTRVSIIGLTPQLLVVEPSLLLLCHSKSLAADYLFAEDFPAIHPILHDQTSK